MVQYIPVSILLCYVYERCNTVWGSIFFHMLVNYISINALKALEALL
jgi:membrane protease YdiL (CAAX protease family)